MGVGCFSTKMYHVNESIIIFIFMDVTTGRTHKSVNGFQILVPAKVIVAYLIFTLATVAVYLPANLPTKPYLCISYAYHILYYIFKCLCAKVSEFPY